MSDTDHTNRKSKPRAQPSDPVPATAKPSLRRMLQSFIHHLMFAKRGPQRTRGAANRGRVIAG